MANGSYVQYVQHMGDELTIVNAARVSYGISHQVLEDKDVGLLHRLYRDGHFGPLEHVSFTVMVGCPLFVARQWMRHRTLSYNEISRRYSNTPLEFYVPNNAYAEQVDALVGVCLSTYNSLVGAGMPKEQARMVLPQNMVTEFYATGNLRNWLHFTSLRSNDDAQFEIRELSWQVENIIHRLWPNVYEAYANEEDRIPVRHHV